MLQGLDGVAVALQHLRLTTQRPGIVAVKVFPQHLVQQSMRLATTNINILDGVSFFKLYFLASSFFFFLFLLCDRTSWKLRGVVARWIRAVAIFTSNDAP